MVAREDWLLGVVGVQNIQMLLYQLFVESNQPLPPMGVKQWSAKLTTGQRAVCAGLPVARCQPRGRPDRDAGRGRRVPAGSPATSSPSPADPLASRV